MIVGGKTGDRASICHASTGKFHYEPISSVDELSQRELERADLFLVWDEGGTIDRLKAAAAASGIWAPMVAVSTQPTVARVVGAIGAGVLDYVDWPGDVERLDEALANALATSAIEAPKRQRPLAARRQLERLTLRERQVALAIARGLSNKVIASELGISPRTVEIHRANLLSKLEVKTSAEAIRVAVEAGLAEDARDPGKPATEPGTDQG